MPSPYKPNLEITFKRSLPPPTSPPPELEIDPVTGNSINPTTGNPEQPVEEYKIRAWVKGASSIQQEPGTNPNTSRVSGKVISRWDEVQQRWVSDRLLPVDISRYQSEAIAVYIDPATGARQPGKFTLNPSLDSRRPVVARKISKKLGSNIEGDLEF